MYTLVGLALGVTLTLICQELWPDIKSVLGKKQSNATKNGSTTRVNGSIA